MLSPETTIPIIQTFLKENDRLKMNSISFSIPVPKCQLYILDAAKLLIADRTKNNFPVVYFSIDSQTKQGRKALALAGHWSIFKDYEVISNSKIFSSYRVFTSDAQLLFKEVLHIIDSLFPLVSKEQVIVNLQRIEARLTIEE
ncbi:hypothetical protein [Desertivirga arenae]|uniref:hypothetical protein n=1 Tax=Desertivirga arenae TaxID=2810309 RepID=UPI001A96AA4F|nr:hypothetical protein [Pedobacter sp. SYSU D00823]